MGTLLTPSSLHNLHGSHSSHKVVGEEHYIHSDPQRSLAGAGSRTKLLISAHHRLLCHLQNLSVSHSWSYIMYHVTAYVILRKSRSISLTEPLTWNGFYTGKTLWMYGMPGLQCDFEPTLDCRSYVASLKMVLSRVIQCTLQEPQFIIEHLAIVGVNTVSGKVNRQ
jgi:hypothetical protein